MNIKTTIAHQSNYSSAVRPFSSIRWIVIHYTVNDGDTDEGNAKYFQTANRKASAHYFCDDDSITQSVPDNHTAWSVGGAKYGDCGTTGGGTKYGTVKNANSISIEMCDTVKDGIHNASEATLQNAIALTQSLMKKYGIDINHVVRHFDVTGKYCPVYFMDNTKWNAFKARVSGAPLAPVDPTPIIIPVVSNENPYTKPTGVIKRGSTGEGTKYVQWELNHTGFACTVDGNFGPNSEKALIAYQNAKGLTPDGKAGPGTLATMRVVIVNTTPKADVETNPYSKPEYVVKRGTNGEGARYVQWALNHAGFPCTVDGCFGGKSELALIAFQNSKGLTPDGKAGPMTLKFL